MNTSPDACSVGKTVHWWKGVVLSQQAGNHATARVLNSRRATGEIPYDSVKSIRSVMFFEPCQRYYEF
jgi:hypothetical protein